MIRKLCKICNLRPVAVNYYKNDKVFYRSKCDHCAKNRTLERPLWSRIGYKKKSECDRCGFKSKYQEQFNIFYIDGNLLNCKPNNLKTVCANCQRLLEKNEFKWKQGDLKPDF